MVPIPSAATVPAAAVEVVANHPAAVSQGAGRVGPHRSAAESITAHARIGDPLEVGPGEFARTAGKATGAEISGRTTVERTAAVEPAASIEPATTVEAAAIDATITTEVAGASAKIAAAADVTAAEVSAAEVATTTAAKVTTAAAKSSTTHRPAATATATKTTTAMTASAAVRPRRRRGGHLARDHGRHDHNSKPPSKRH